MVYFIQPCLLITARLPFPTKLKTVSVLKKGKIKKKAMLILSGLSELIEVSEEVSGTEEVFLSGFLHHMRSRYLILTVEFSDESQSERYTIGQEPKGFYDRRI